jgi:hypothetical protein
MSASGSMCLYSLGKVRDAGHIADSLRARFAAGSAGDSTFSPVLIARGLAEYYAWTGDGEESLAWLDRAWALSPAGEDFRVIASGIYDKVWNEPRFKAGLQRARTRICERVRRPRLGAPQT